MLFMWIIREPCKQIHLQAQNNEAFFAALGFFPKILCDTSPFLENGKYFLVKHMKSGVRNNLSDFYMSSRESGISAVKED